MGSRLSEYRVFFREFLRNFHTTGAVLPSGPWLAAALTRHVRQSAGPRRILEVGPGTGAVTRRIVAAIQPDDHFDMVELNETFVRQLRDLFQTDSAFRRVADRSRVLHCAVEDLPADSAYDVIVSGLPLNNFSAELVERILTLLVQLLKPDGTLSFFEYIGVRRARAVVSSRAERDRLAGIGRAMNAVLKEGEFRRDWVWPNIPPAWVHHVRRPAQAANEEPSMHV